MCFSKCSHVIHLRRRTCLSWHLSYASKHHLERTAAVPLSVLRSRDPHPANAAYQPPDGDTEKDRKKNGDDDPNDGSSVGVWTAVNDGAGVGVR